MVQRGRRHCACHHLAKDCRPGSPDYDGAMTLARTLFVLITILLTATQPETAIAQQSACADKAVTAKGIRTRDDVRAFVSCAAEYVAAMGTAEAYRAFHEDERWHRNPYYLFVDTLAPSGDEVITISYPPDPSLEGIPSGNYPDAFGADIHAERYRILNTVEEGWWYYGWTNFTTNLIEPKASYVTAIDWDGTPALIGAGIYENDLPGTCHATVVNAARLEAAPSPDTLREFVNCAAQRLESQGYFAIADLVGNRRWRDGSVYLFGVDEVGIQIFTGHPVRVNGLEFLEWGTEPRAMFSDRDAVDLAMTFGEAHFYYAVMHPTQGRVANKVGFVKRVVAQGIPVLVGAGYFTE